MWLRVLTLSLCLPGSFAHPAPEGMPGMPVAQRDAPPSSATSAVISSAVVPPDEQWHGKLPELDWSVSDGDEKTTSTRHSILCFETC